MMLCYFLHVQLWAHAHRQVFHCGVDTNNITESFNHILRQRYLPLRHDTTIFALVQILVEVVFPEQEIRYIQATIKQTAAYRKPKYELPQFLQEKPHTIQSICLMNIERAKAIPKSHVTQKESVGVYSLASSSSGSEQSYGQSIFQLGYAHAQAFYLPTSRANTCLLYFITIHNGAGTIYPRNSPAPLT